MNNFYKKVMDKVIARSLNRRVFSFIAYKEKEDEEKDYTMCLYTEEKQLPTSLYIFSKKDNRFLPVELEKLPELEQEGLILGRKPDDFGVKRFRRAFERMKKQSEKMFEKD